LNIIKYKYVLELRHVVLIYKSLDGKHKNNNQSTLEGPIRAMPQLTERNQLM